MSCGERTPPDFPAHCDGSCNAPFALQHVLACKKGGLVIFRHGEIRDELVNLAENAFAPSAARDELLIKPSRVKEGEKDAPTKDTSPEKTEQTAAGEDERGDILIRGFWASGTDCMLDVRVTDTNAQTCCKQDPVKALESQEKERKRKHLEACLERIRRFAPFLCSADGMLGREAKTFVSHLAGKLAGKWEKSYSQVCECVNARLSIAIVRAIHLCVRGSRVPAHKISIRCPQWEEGAGLPSFVCLF
jgi:hypothetical protein